MRSFLHVIVSSILYCEDAFISKNHIVPIFVYVIQFLFSKSRPRFSLFFWQRRQRLVGQRGYSAPINRCLNVVVRSPAPFGLGRNSCWPSRGSQLSRALPFIFWLCCPLNDRRKTALSFFWSPVFSLFLPFSCPSSSPHSSSLDER